MLTVLNNILLVGIVLTNVILSLLFIFVFIVERKIKNIQRSKKVQDLQE